MPTANEEPSIFVYTAVDATGRVRFVGRTRNLERRAAEHAARGWTVRGLPKPASMDAARGLEQMLIDLARKRRDVL